MRSRLERDLSMATVAVVAAFALAALILTAGCTAFQVAQTPAQRVYAAMSTYAIVVEAAAQYANSPNAEPVIVEAMVSVDRRAREALRFAKAAVAAGDAAKMNMAADVLEGIADELRGLVAQGAEPPQYMGAPAEATP